MSVGKATTGDVVNHFLARSDQRVQAGELSAVSFPDSKFVGALVVEHPGRAADPEQLGPIDFAAFRQSLAERYSPARLSKAVTVCRMKLRWAFESELIDRMPRFGPDFKVASKKAARIRKAGQGQKLLTAEEVRAILDKADSKWRAILLLCLNGGPGNSDIARIRLSDVGGQWLDLPRGKTGIERRIPLWPQTREAIAAAMRHDCDTSRDSSKGEFNDAKNRTETRKLCNCMVRCP